MEYAATRKEIKKLRKEAEKLAKSFLTEGLEKLFAKHPDAYAVSWTQSAPSFNDGDVSGFSCNACDAEVLGKDEVDLEDDEYDELLEDGATQVASKTVEAFQDFLTKIDDEDFEAMFGEGVRVTIDRKLKVTTDDYYNY